MMPPSSDEFYVTIFTKRHYHFDKLTWLAYLTHVTNNWQTFSRANVILFAFSSTFFSPPSVISIRRLGNSVNRITVNGSG